MKSVQAHTINEKLLVLPLGRLCRDYLDYLRVEAGLSQNSILAYGRDLISFLQYCERDEVDSLEKLGPGVIQKYTIFLSKKGRSESSIKRSLVAIRMLLRFARLNGLIEDDFAGLLESPKLWQRLPVVCSKEKIIDLLEAPLPDEMFYLRDRAILELLYGTGMRASELAGLKISDLNLDIGYLRCMGKGGKERVIPFGKVAMRATKEYLMELRPKLMKPFSGDSVLLSRTGRPLGRIEIWRLIKKYALRAGMARNLTVHTLRHCFATHLLAGGG